MYTVVLPQLSVRSFLTGRTVSGRCRRAEILSGDKSNIPYPALPVKPDAEIARLSAFDGMNPADFAGQRGFGRQTAEKSADNVGKPEHSAGGFRPYIQTSRILRRHGT